MPETEVTIGLQPSGRNSTQLCAAVGNDLQVSWHLTDVQLFFLAEQAVKILHQRAQNHSFEAIDMRNKLKEIANGL